MPAKYEPGFEILKNDYSLNVAYQHLSSHINTDLRFKSMTEMMCKLEEDGLKNLLALIGNFP